MIKRFLKRIIFKQKFKNIGFNVIVKNGKFGHSENIVIGNNVYIGPDSYWDALGGINIGDNVIIGPKSTIWTYNHNYKEAKYLPYDEIEILEKVVIETNVWLGINVIIKPGIHIGEGAIIAMGSVLTKDVPKLAIMGGNPAKVLSFRDKDHYYDLKENEKFYLKIKSDLVKQYRIKK